MLNQVRLLVKSAPLTDSLMMMCVAGQGQAPPPQHGQQLQEGEARSPPSHPSAPVSHIG